MHRFTLALVPAIVAASAFAQDPVRDTVQQAEQRYRRDLDQANAALVDAIAATEARETSDAARARCVADRDGFVKHGLLPATAPAAARKFEQSVARITTKLEKAIDNAILSYRKRGDGENVERMEALLERTRDEHAQLVQRDLRSQLDALGLVGPVGWTWQGTSVVSGTENPRALGLWVGRDFPASYVLAVGVERRGGVGDLHLAFPYSFAGKRSLGLLALGHESLLLNATAGTDAVTAVQRKDLLGINRPATITLAIHDGAVRVQVDGDEVLAVDLEDLAPMPDPLAAAFPNPDGPQLLPSGDAAFALCSARLRVLEQKIEVTGPVARPVLEPGSSWAGTWDGSGKQDGICRDMEVSSRTEDMLVLKVTTNAGGVFEFHLQIKGQSLKVRDIVHLRTARRGGTPMGLSEASGSGRVTKDGFSFSFGSRRDQGNRHDAWSGRIEGRRQR